MLKPKLLASGAALAKSTRFAASDDTALVRLVVSAQIKLRRIDGWKKIVAVLSQHTAMAAKGVIMAKKKVARIAMIGMLFGAFALGYVCGSASLPRASAQIPQLPGGLGAAVQLGSSIKEMEQH